MTMATPKGIASRLHGWEYPIFRNTDFNAVIDDAKAAGLVIVYGSSDDLMELVGAISDELNCWGGGKFRLSRAGIANCETGPATLKAIWSSDGKPPAWSYSLDIPHETFDVMEDGEVFCRGLVFAISDIPDDARQRFGNLMEVLHELSSKDPGELSDVVEDLSQGRLLLPSDDELNQAATALDDLKAAEHQRDKTLEEYERAMKRVAELERECDKYSTGLLAAQARNAPDEARDKAAEAVAEALAGALDCTRVWEAWGVGTMGPSDFVEVAGDINRLYEITDAALEAAGHPPPKPLPDAVPDGWRETATAAAKHLENWLDANECDCEMTHICGRPSVERTRDKLLALIDAAAPPARVAVPDGWEFHAYCNIPAVGHPDQRVIGVRVTLPERPVEPYPIQWIRDLVCSARPTPSAPVAVPEGWRLVPENATAKMIERARTCGAGFGFGAQYETALSAAPPAPAVESPAPVPYEDHEQEVLKEIEARDYWEEKATELAERVGEHFGFDVGEHSNCNCPVTTALEADWPAPAPVDDREEKEALRQALKDVLGAWVHEADQGDGILDEHGPIYARATILAHPGYNLPAQERQACQDAAPQQAAPAVDEQSRAECADALEGVAETLNYCNGEMPEPLNSIADAITECRQLAARLRAQQQEGDSQ